MAVINFLPMNVDLTDQNKILSTDDYTYTGSAQLIQDGDEGWRLKFLSTGTFTPKKDLTIDAFLVGGGGGGASAAYICGGAGGGGGECATISTYSFSLQAGWAVQQPLWLGIPLSGVLMVGMAEHITHTTPLLRVVMVALAVLVAVVLVHPSITTAVQMVVMVVALILAQVAGQLPESLEYLLGTFIVVVVAKVIIPVLVNLVMVVLVAEATVIILLVIQLR